MRALHHIALCTVGIPLAIIAFGFVCAGAVIGAVRLAVAMGASPEVCFFAGWLAFAVVVSFIVGVISWRAQRS